MDDDLSVSVGGTAADRAERLTRSMRDQSFPNLKPRDSATLILVDRSSGVPKVLLGRPTSVIVFYPANSSSRAAVSNPPIASSRPPRRCTSSTLES
jgi:hypothetical protein